MIDLKYSGRSASLLAVLPLVCLPMAVTGQRVRENAVPLRNWATPLYWQANQAENAVQGSPLKAAPQLVFSANQVSANALTFIAITPCRLVDTRGAAAGFNGISPFSGPSIPALGTITIPVQSPTEASSDTTPAPCGVIPSIAQAYSFNLTVVPPAAGAAVDYVSLWPAGSAQPFVSTLDDPQGAIVSNAVIVPAGPTSSPGYGGVSVYNHGPATTDVIIDMNGYYAAPTDVNDNTAIGSGTLASNTTGIENTATGSNALQDNTTGTWNTASGYDALASNTTGGGNTAFGSDAMASNTTGIQNTASGYSALYANTTGNNNVASGDYALLLNTTGSDNTATGTGALLQNTTGSDNAASGWHALSNNTTGGNNIAIGYGAALNVAGGNSNNIDIGSAGVSSDGTGSTGVIRIGTVGTQTSTYVAGIYGGTPSSPNLLVCVDANGTLGTSGCSSTPSSRRFKEQIADMGDSSSKLLQLRPVTFLYKPEYDDGSHALQYGLIAEEVATLYPEMVGYDKDGQPSSVKYQLLTPMLLNEVQKQNTQIQNQDVQMRKQAEAIQLQQEQNRKLEDRLAALEALLSAQTPTAARPAGSQ